MKKIVRIVMTGGPCSGKSTFMDKAMDYYTKKGYVVLIDHEAATDLITGGISPASMGMYQFQKYVIGLQLKKEELFLEAAKEIQGDKVLLFYDRAIFDDKGYVSPEEFTKILSTFNLKEEELYARYDLVIHMTTVAKSVSSDFSNINNAARYEDVEEACAVDDTILKSWQLHPERKIVEGQENFSLKLQYGLDLVDAYLKEHNI